MKALCSLVVFVGLASTQPEDNRAWQVFLPSDVKNLKEDQKKIYDRLKGRATTKGIAVYRSNNLYGGIEFAKKVNIQFKLNGNEVEILGCTSKKGIITLEKEGNTSVTLTVKDSTIIGLMHVGKRVYNAEPLGNFQVAIIELDMTKFPKD